MRSTRIKDLKQNQIRRTSPTMSRSRGKIKRKSMLLLLASNARKRGIM
uniref:Uncharacterized protein n=1 Tax=Arundo donax TaxID=35708 RepID=A0A0A9FM41_ARUDO